MVSVSLQSSDIVVPLVHGRRRRVGRVPARPAPTCGRRAAGSRATRFTRSARVGACAAVRASRESPTRRDMVTGVAAGPGSVPAAPTMDQKKSGDNRRESEVGNNHIFTRVIKGARAGGAGGLLARRRDFLGRRTRARLVSDPTIVGHTRDERPTFYRLNAS
ncbi:hypothetical protein EVAR_100215_1 [Eumeta japonica]|uniref:Uncharacterized protein n=1 Tax=Eumeta variegata TaxID=151549 RepID=A0A4C1ZJ92_EUMVA|nr:hypothetical protein EVAR_100215_1 [Eumeta japonica]